ncbi:Chemotaxis protein methyltransferase CheR [hydrothermal vent metagenome]|uniref:protein-glutamate O-methyltransferase n=1 Tax=hydrothermal vent metagenome TaxID=652676 RepID=A0A3B0RYV7_9ZZZZ
MRKEDFDLLSKILKERSGLVLSEDKVYLLESRLTPIARKKGMETLDDLINEIRLRRKEDLLSEVTDAMTTNESFFFRDNTPFDLFKEDVLPGLLKSRATSKRLRIWCAAASTGQEPYSLAIILKEMEAQLSGWRIEIVGTDLSQQVLDKAKAGIYSQFEVQRGLPIKLLMKYFTQAGEMWQISENIRNMVTYRPFNLLENFSLLGSFDVIFCRNVLIYFHQDTKGDVLNRLRGQLPDDGTLFLGAAETVLGLTDKFKPVSGKRGMYKTSDFMAQSLKAG